MSLPDAGELDPSKVKPQMVAPLTSPPASSLSGTLGKRGTTQPRPLGSAAARRWHLLQTARAVTSRKSMRTCGLFAAEGNIRVGLNDRGSASVSGVHTCGSKLCPVCQSRDAAAQLAKLERAATKLMDGAGCAVFVTLTLPHERGDDLGELLDHLQAGWNSAFSGRGGKLWKRHGKIHHFRGLDYTHGQNGHHPHYHAVFFFSSVLSQEDLYWLELDLRTRWNRSIKRSCGRDCAHQAVKIDLVSGEGGAGKVVRYAGKALTGGMLESLWSQGKTLGGRTLWEILAGAETNSRDELLWKELEDGFYKRRWLVTSRGLLDLGEEEEELEAENEDELLPESLVELSQGLWSAINRARLVGIFLTHCETHETNPKRFQFWKELCALSLVAHDVKWADWLPGSNPPPERSEV